MQKYEYKVVPPPLPSDKGIPPSTTKKSNNYKVIMIVIAIIAVAVMLFGRRLFSSGDNEPALKDKRLANTMEFVDGGNQKKGTYTHISDEFNFIIEFNDVGGTSQEIISIYRKRDNSLSQRIVCEVNISGLSTTSRSFITGYMKEADCLDFDCGDIVVADFNFDGLEDFGIKRDCSNSGCAYIVFIQSPQGGFYKDEELTDLMVGLPGEFDNHTKTMTIYGMSGCCTTTETSITYNQGKWTSTYQEKEID